MNSGILTQYLPGLPRLAAPSLSVVLLALGVTAGCDRDRQRGSEGVEQSGAEIQEPAQGQPEPASLASGGLHGVTFNYPEETTLTRNDQEASLSGALIYPVDIEVMVSAREQGEENGQGRWINAALYQRGNACVEVDCQVRFSQPPEAQRYGASRDICESLTLPEPEFIPEILNISTRGHSFLGECTEEDRHLSNHLVEAAGDEDLLGEISACWEHAMSGGTVNSNQRVSVLWGVRPQNSPSFEVRFSPSESDSQWAACVESGIELLLRSTLPVHARTSPACNLGSFVVSYGLGQRVNCL